MIRVALDACVLYSMPVADILLRLSEPGAGLCEATWSDESLEETKRVFVRRGRTQEQADHRADAMVRAFPEATVSRTVVRPSTEPLEDEKDRHVIDAARHGAGFAHGVWEAMPRRRRRQ